MTANKLYTDWVALAASCHSHDLNCDKVDYFREILSTSSPCYLPYVQVMCTMVPLVHIQYVQRQPASDVLGFLAVSQLLTHFR